MKKSLLLLCVFVLLGSVGALTAWQKSQPSAEPSKPAAGGVGESVQLKAGRGLAFHPRLRANLNLQTAEVAEQAIAPVVQLDLLVTTGASAGGGLRRITQDSTPQPTLASGWLFAAEAARLAPGQEMELRVAGSGGAPSRGRVLRIEKSAYAVLGDFEVVVETAGAFDAGTKLSALFRLSAGEAVPSVPRSALLQTAEGNFVYAVNDGFYLRTAVKVGAANDQFVELTEGVYVGDEIVVSPVQSLWMAELQLLRGGKSCTCGH